MDGIVKPLLFLFGTSRRLDGPYFAGLDVVSSHYSIRGRSTNVHKLNLPASLLFKIQGIVHFVQQGDLLKMLSIGGCTV